MRYRPFARISLSFCLIALLGVLLAVASPASAATASTGVGARVVVAAEAAAPRLIGPAGDAAAQGLTRMGRFRALAQDGIQIGDRRFGINEHLLNNLVKSGRRGITPEDVIGALHETPSLGTPGSFIYTNSGTGTRVIVNESDEIISAWPASFR